MAYSKLVLIAVCVLTTSVYSQDGITVLQNEYYPAAQPTSYPFLVGRQLSPATEIMHSSPPAMINSSCCVPIVPHLHKAFAIRLTHYYLVEEYVAVLIPDYYFPNGFMKLVVVVVMLQHIPRPILIPVKLRRQLNQVKNRSWWFPKRSTVQLGSNRCLHFPVSAAGMKYAQCLVAM